jgi:hypothetical protein
MILFDLICSDGHRFEAWFRSGEAFDEQQQERAIECPICSDRAVGKAPMAPRVARGLSAPAFVGEVSAPDGDGAGETAVMAAGGVPSGAAGAGADDDGAAAVREILGHLRRHVEGTCDYVGPSFPEEARRMHYGEIETRDIYGEASPEQAEALRDEGIEVRSIPWMVRRDG